MQEFILQLLDKALVGVIVGVLLSPIVSNWVDRQRNKKSLRFDLIKAVTKYYNYRKLTIQLGNTKVMKVKEQTFYWNVLLVPTVDETTRRELERRNLEIKEGINANTDTINTYFEKLVEAESDIYATLSKIERYYNKAKRLEIENILDKLVMREGTDNFAFGLEINSENFAKVEKEISAKVILKLQELDREFQRFVPKLNELL